MLLSEQIQAIDNGRFKNLCRFLDFKESCLKCMYFNQTITDIREAYRCRVPGSCPGATLSSEMINYLLWQIGVKTEAEFDYWRGI